MSLYFFCEQKVIEFPLVSWEEDEVNRKQLSRGKFMPEVDTIGNEKSDRPVLDKDGQFCDLLAAIQASRSNVNNSKRKSSLSRKKQLELDAWKRRYRRQFLIQQLDILARFAREEGFSSPSLLLHDAANKLRLAFCQNDDVEI